MENIRVVQNNGTSWFNASDICSDIQVSKSSMIYYLKNKISEGNKQKLCFTDGKRTTKPCWAINTQGVEELSRFLGKQFNYDAPSVLETAEAGTSNDANHDIPMVLNNDLVPVHSTNTGHMYVTGRELHSTLKIQTEYKKWFSRVQDYGFDENVDYQKVSQKCHTAGGDQTKTDHVISLDMAIHICLRQKTPIGKQIRLQLLNPVKEAEKHRNTKPAMAEQIPNDQVFTFQGSNIRTLKINDEPWFVGKDVASVLGYSDLNKAIAIHVDDEDKKLNDKTSSSFGQRGATLINEAGMYSLVLSSKLPSARFYSTNGATDMNHVIQLTVQETVKLCMEQIKESLPSMVANTTTSLSAPEAKAIYPSLIKSQTELMRTTLIAKDYGMRAADFNKYVADLGIQHRVGKHWEINPDLDGKDLARMLDGNRGDNAYQFMVWTKKGRQYLYEQLKASGLLPLVER